MAKFSIICHKISLSKSLFFKVDYLTGLPSALVDKISHIFVWLTKSHLTIFVLHEIHQTHLLHCFFFCIWFLYVRHYRKIHISKQWVKADYIQLFTQMPRGTKASFTPAYLSWQAWKMCFSCIGWSFFPLCHIVYSVIGNRNGVQNLRKAATESKPMTFFTASRWVNTKKQCHFNRREPTLK